MEERVGLVFSWDPRTREWVKERGPEDAAPPPAPPIDPDAVQTYFLDPANGRWQGTILGLRARQIAAELKTLYRTPAVSGLAVAEPQARVAPPDTGSRSNLRMIAAVLVLVVLIGGGAVAANTVLQSAPQATAPAATGATTPAATASTAAAATSSAAAATSSAATTQTPAASAVPTPGGGGRTPAGRTPAPTVAPITSTQFSTRLANGTTITFTGPSGVIQGTAWDARFRAVQANGQPALDNLTVYVGPIGASQAVTVTSSDGSGNYFASVRVTLPKGDQLLSVKLGQNGEVRVMGTISVR